MLTPSLKWLMIEIRDAHGNLTYRDNFITDLPVNRENVAELAACGGARSKIENEAFNVLKTNATTWSTISATESGTCRPCWPS